MNQQLWIWIGWGVSILSVVAIAWLFSNPKEIGVKETRTLAAKAKAREVFWLIAMTMSLMTLFHFLALSLRHQPLSGFRVEVIPWLLAVPTGSAMVFLIVYWVRTPAGIAEAASDEMVKAWKSRRPTTTTFMSACFYAIGYFVVSLFLA